MKCEMISHVCFICRVTKFLFLDQESLSFRLGIEEGIIGKEHTRRDRKRNSREESVRRTRKRNLAVGNDFSVKSESFASPPEVLGL